MNTTRFARRVRIRVAEELRKKGHYPKQKALDALEQSTKVDVEKMLEKEHGNRTKASSSRKASRG